MNLKVGESRTFKLGFWLKAIDISCESMSLRLERSRGSICLYANNGSRRSYYCAMPLGGAKTLKGFEYTVKAQSKTRMLFSVGQVKFVIDFAVKKAATNLVGYQIYGSKEWGDHVQLPWKAEFLPLFGLPMPPAVMDKQIAELFWKWFWENESAIKELASGKSKEVKHLNTQLQLWLSPMFLYIKSGAIDVKLECGETENTFIFHHGGNEQLAADAELFGTMMPEALARDWDFVLEE